MEQKVAVELFVLLIGVVGALVGVVWRMVNGRLKAIDTRIDTVEKKVETKMDTVTEKLVHVETNYIDRFTQMYQQLHEAESNIMMRIDTRLSNIDDKIDDIKNIVHNFALTVMRKDECKALMEASDKI